MEGIYIGAMGMLKSQNHINTHSNNIANVNSNGYKFDTMVAKVFENTEAYRNESGNRTFIGDFANKVVDEGTIINLKPGQTKLTNSALDAAFNDANSKDVSFFVVSMNNKQYLTRNGEFEIDEQGQLKTMSGAYVMDTNNQIIKIPKNVKPTVDSEGNIRDTETERIFGKLQTKIISNNDRQNLNKEASGMFSYAGNINNLPTSSSEIKSNTLEISNVDLSKEMVDLMSSQREFQANQKAFLSYDKVLDKEANQLIK